MRWFREIPYASAISGIVAFSLFRYFSVRKINTLRV
jgi:hypothetical protein